MNDAQDVQDAVKQVFAPIFEAMLNGELDSHLGRKKHERLENAENSRNGYSTKNLKTSLGKVHVQVPRDRQGMFQPEIVKKHQTDVSSIEGKVFEVTN